MLRCRYNICCNLYFEFSQTHKEWKSALKSTGGVMLTEVVHCQSTDDDDSECSQQKRVGDTGEGEKWTQKTYWIRRRSGRHGVPTK
mmetsp:Transcript_32594/g.52804  ORF Transcript_32594/g.52804 Transcript_32594/m.52804 type:complete len:86 (+) Transcript_32594:164-421(+)